MTDHHGTGGFQTRPNRRSIRLKGYDYSQAGAYFITICTKDRACLFGEVVDGEMRLNDFGQVVHGVWNNLPNHYAGVEMDAFVVMPNHVHGIVVIVGAGLKPAPTTTAAPTTTTAPTQHGLPEIIRGFKTFSARRINELRSTPGVPVWQRNYYEHIIRNEESLHRIREYIANNPLKWQLDQENPDRVGAVRKSPLQ
ncbi:MAG: hypothetical protein KatS3mg067_2265 [Thermosynechococcus sp.]|uniref:transposase n=1 Tax=Thermosynechococcus sp. TaxID=2814275 RepID=UPI002202A4A6|nr:transposase [Thermosynechococcus sp.]BCX13327.1 MAG: hypothetical protein KatS3mg067_2265 [Thermosynechococcus sp.]